MSRKNIAVIGAGISGIVAAQELSKSHNVSVFEKNHYLGGHTDTHNIHINGTDYNVDSGFIVYNESNYPNFCEFIDQLGVSGRDTTMSFSVHNTASGLEYNATDLNRLFCQRKNLVSPRFYRMLWDLTRFYREAPKLLDSSDNTADDTLTLGEYLAANNYSACFIDDHIIPMACALWSGPSISISQFPARYFVKFMHNHNMLSLGERPQWRTIKGGSSAYVSAWEKQFEGTIYLGADVSSLISTPSGVEVISNGEKLTFDAVCLAVHSDTALQMLPADSNEQAKVLSGIHYQQNTMHLHCDTRILPTNKAAWAAWNARVSPELNENCTVSYSMNLLQGIRSDTQFIVSLNSGNHIDPKKVFVERHYSHPIYTTSTLRSQAQWEQINGINNLYFCGAYWGWGFHEDGVKSGKRAAQLMLHRFNEEAFHVA